MSVVANTLNYPEGGGHFWVYLNWALGLVANGCEVAWVEGVPARQDRATLDRNLTVLRQRLHRHGLESPIALFEWSEAAPALPLRDALDLASLAAEADLVLNFAYDVPAPVVNRFRRSALVDIDPGLTQLWISTGQLLVAPHTFYFTTGETVGTSSLIPDCGVRWIYTPPCVALRAWPVVRAAPAARFTTVSHWYADEWVGSGADAYHNDKREGFLPFLDLPRLTPHGMELALSLGSGSDADTERAMLERRGWAIRNSSDVAGTPDDYRRYVQGSRGEFSCVKPSCVRLQNAWISDRTLCYLASGKPAIVQHTGSSRLLPDSAGLLRFRTIEEAAAMLDRVVADYDRQCHLARRLVEECFDAIVVTRRVLERAFA